VIRDKDYEKTKSYFQREVLQVNKDLVWCKFSDELIIGDIYLGEDDLPLLMKKLTGLARTLGLSRIQFHTSPGTRLHQLFCSGYAELPSFPALVQDFGSGLTLEKVKFTLADIDIF